MDELANKGTQDPRGEHVHCWLKRDAEEKIRQIGDAQVQDEDVGGAAMLSRFALSQHGDDQRVSQDPQSKNESENQKGDEVVGTDSE